MYDLNKVNNPAYSNVHKRLRHIKKQIFEFGKKKQKKKMRAINYTTKLCIMMFNYYLINKGITCL